MSASEVVRGSTRVSHHRALPVADSTRWGMGADVLQRAAGLGQA